MLLTRTSNRKYAVGFDLGDEESQVSYVANGEEPITYSLEPGSEDFEIPTVLTKKTGENIWLCGQEAIVRASRGEGTKVLHFLNAALEGSPIMIEGQEYDPASLVALFVRRVLTQISAVVPTEEISVLTFTLDRMDEKVIETMEKVKAFLNLSLDGMYWENRQNSFFSYMLRQNDSLHEKDALLFQYDGKNPMKLTRLCYNSNTTPIAVFTKSEELSSMSAEMLGENSLDATFLAELEEHVKEGDISSAFLIGKGFSGEPWMKDSLRFLAYHRRVFLGNNLFSKGAAISGAYRKENEGRSGRYFFLGENCLTVNLGLMVLRGEHNAYYPVLDAGTSWYEVNEEREFIVSGTPEMILVFTPLTGGEVKEERMEFTGLPERQGRTIRILISFRMKDVHTLVVEASDLGFGEIFDSTGLTWEKEYRWD